MKGQRSNLPHDKSEITFEDISSLFLTLIWKRVILQILERYLPLFHGISVKIVLSFYENRITLSVLPIRGTVASIICDLKTKKNVQRSILTFTEKHQTCRDKFS